MVFGNLWIYGEDIRGISALNRNSTSMFQAGGKWDAEGKTEGDQEGEAGGVEEGNELEGDYEELDNEVAEGRDRRY